MRLSAFIMSHMESILQDWEDFARSLGDVTYAMDSTALRDHAELMLRAIAADIEIAQTTAEQEAKSQGRAPTRPARFPVTAATSHGSMRAAEGFSLEQMVAEYRALRASVLRLWSRKEPQALLEPDAYEQQIRFNEAVDQALADSIKAYARALDQIVVSRARYRMSTLGTLAAGLGHDMANVLLPMRACLHGLAHENLPEGAAPLVDALDRSVEHLAGLCKGLRALTLDPEGPADAYETTTLHEWWASAISPFTWALPRGVRLHAEGMNDPSLPPVRVPAHVLMQAVFNIVQNAAQALGKRNAASPAGAPQSGNIWIAARRTPDAVHLTIRDDGPGMDANTLARCTDAFYTTKAKDQGTGLGLYLARSVTERHGGRLVAESALGAGTTFTLVLPVAPTAAATDPGSPPPPTITTVRPRPAAQRAE